MTFQSKSLKFPSYKKVLGSKESLLLKKKKKIKYDKNTN